MGARASLGVVAAAAAARLRIRTQLGSMRDAAHVPHLAFELVAAELVELRELGTPPSGPAWKDPGRGFWLGTEVLASGRTDERGEALVLLARTPALEGDPPPVAARIVEPGYQQRPTYAPRVAQVAEDGVATLRLNARRGATARPRVPLVRVFAARGDAHSPVVAGEPLAARALAPHSVVFEPERPGRFLIGALGGGYGGELAWVELAPGDGHVALELRAYPPQPLARLRIRVLQAGAELTGTDISEPEFDLRLHALDADATLLARERFGTAPFVFEAPAGRYRLVAEGAAFVDTWHGTVHSRRSSGRVERELTLVSGEELEVELASCARPRRRGGGQRSGGSCPDSVPFRVRGPTWALRRRAG